MARTWRLLAEARRGARESESRATERRRALLAAALERARSDVPFYRELWGERPLTLSELPVIAKQQVRAALESGDLLARGARPTIRQPTSGSSGAALLVPRGASEQRRWRAGALVAWLEHGYRWRDRVAHLDAGADPSRTPAWGTPPRAAWISTAIDDSALARALMSAEPDLLAGTPAALRRACRSEEDLPRPRLVFSQGEVLDRATGDLIEERLGTAAFDLYGLTETGYVAWQCPRREHLHVNADLCLVELMAGDRPAQPGEIGSVVVTDLRAAAAPMIRYDTGDLARAVEQPCGCGCELPLIGRIEGRAADPFGALTRRLLDSSPLAPDRFALRQDGDSVELRVAGGEDAAAAARQAERALGAAVRIAEGFEPPPARAYKLSPWRPARP